MAFTVETAVRPMPTYKEMLDQLIARRAAAIAEVDRLDAIIRTFQEAEELLKHNRPEPTFTLTTTHTTTTRPESRSDHLVSEEDAGGLPPDEISKYARHVLLDIGRPLKRGALVRALEERGIAMVGIDKAKNLGTILWRTKGAFANIKGFGYWPSDVPLPGIYEPGRLS